MLIAAKKSTIKSLYSDINWLFTIILSTGGWRFMMKRFAFESSWIARQKMKRSFSKVDDVELPDHIGDRHELTCDICVRLCLSKDGKWSHMWGHYTRTSTNYEMDQILIIHVIFGEDMEISTKRKLITTKCMCVMSANWQKF